MMKLILQELRCSSWSGPTEEANTLRVVDIPVFLESSPEETKARRIKRGRDENAASPFICRVVELEQEKLDLQSKNARIVVGKDGKVYEQ